MNSFQHKTKLAVAIALALATFSVQAAEVEVLHWCVELHPNLTHLAQ